MTTAWDVASDPDLFSRPVRLGRRGRKIWEVLCPSADETKVRFARLDPDTLRQIDVWVDPDTEVFFADEEEVAR